MRRFCQLLCFCMMLSLFPIQALAGVNLDYNGDGQIHIDDTVKMTKDLHLDPDQVKSAISQITPAVQTPILKGDVEVTAISENEPVAGAEVEIVGSTLPPVITGTNGKAVFSGVMVSIANQVRVTKDGYTESFSNPFNVLAGQTSSVVVTLPAAPAFESVTGYVYGSTGVGLPGAFVKVMSSTSTTLSTYTDSFGYYIIDNLPVPPACTISSEQANCMIDVAASADGYYQNNISSIMIPGSIVRIGTISLSPVITVGTVKGKIFKEDHQIFEGANVTISVSSSTYLTNADGIFMISGITAGSYFDLTISAPGYNPTPIYDLILSTGQTLDLGELTLTRVL